MAARKGNGRQAVRNSKGGFPGWGYAIIGILIGAVLMAAYLRHSPNLSAPQGPQPNATATAAPGGDAGLAPAVASTAPKKPQFDFYSVLPEKDVRIPDEQLSAMAKAEQQQQQKAGNVTAAAQNAAPTPAAPPVSHPVATPGVTQQTVTAAPAQAVAPPPASAGGYLLQVGAFPSTAQAESMKAQLAMQGFVANVQQVSINGQTYHRVRLGPFHTATALEATKQRLSAAGISAIALKEGN